MWNNVNNVKTIYIGLDVSTTKTGISILVNDEPFFHDECITDNNAVGDGQKMVEGAHAIFDMLGKSKFVPFVKQLKANHQQPWIIVVVENGLFFDANVSRKLSLWSGLWAAWFILIFKKASLSHKLKFVAANEWQQRAIPWTKEELLIKKTNAEGERLIKQKSLKRANDKLATYGIKVDSDNVADAFNLASVAYSVRDFSEAKWIRKKDEAIELKLKKEIPVWESRLLKLQGELQEKRNKVYLKIMQKPNPVNPEKILTSPLEMYSNKSQDERRSKATKRLKEIKKQLKQIKENKKIKNKI